MRYHFRVLRALPDLGLVPGDLVSYDATDPVHPYVLWRPLPLDPGALLDALNTGAMDGTIPPHLAAAESAARQTARPALRLLPRETRSTA